MWPHRSSSNPILAIVLLATPSRSLQPSQVCSSCRRVRTFFFLWGDRPEVLPGESGLPPCLPSSYASPGPLTVLPSEFSLIVQNWQCMIQQAENSLNHNGSRRPRWLKFLPKRTVLGKGLVMTTMVIHGGPPDSRSP